MQNLNFLSGKSEIGALIINKDWSQTKLGIPDYWPQSLKTALSIILNSKFPMFIFWGDDSIFFYNDAYRPSLGSNGKHPDVLGLSVENGWQEIWDLVQPLIQQVKTTGEPYLSENELIPIFRNGKLENVYWTFSYSPIFDETNNIAGIFGACLETTNIVNHLNSLEKINQQYYNHIMQAPVAMCVLTVDSYVVEIANDMMLAIWGKRHEQVINKPIFEAIKEARGQGLEEILKNVSEKGEKFEANERQVNLLRNGIMETIYLNFVYEPIKDEFNKVKNIVAIAIDVSAIVENNFLIKQNEAKLNIIVDASELGIWEYDMKTKQGILSDRYAEILNFKYKEEITREKILEKLHPADLEIRNQADLDVIETGILKYETRVIWDDQSIHWIAANGKMFFDDDNNPVKMIGTIRDITNEKRHEQVLKDREEKFRLLADEMPQFVWTADANGNVDYYNKSLYNYTGLSVTTLINNGWLEFVHPNDLKENLKVWTEAVKTGEDYIFENRFKRFDGEYRWQLSRAKPHKDEHGKIQMWVGTSTDINDIKELDQQKDFFISMASHELKTPLTSVKGYVQLMQVKYKNTDDDFLKNAIKVVSKQVDMLTNLTTGLLDVSKIKSGSLVLKKTLFNISDLINEVIEEISHINPQHQITFDCQHQTQVYVDREKINQVLINFLNNAIKYSPNSLKINVYTELDKDKVKVAVVDNGIGLIEADRKMVFERFYRVEGKNEKTFSGFGIGLFIASEIIRKHDGEIAVDSVLGEGSTFYFKLPIKK